MRTGRIEVLGDWVEMWKQIWDACESMGMVLGDEDPPDISRLLHVCSEIYLRLMTSDGRARVWNV